MKKLNEILGTKYPFIQGGMANIATGEFAAACSNAGALGMIATGGQDCVFYAIVLEGGEEAAPLPAPEPVPAEKPQLPKAPQEEPRIWEKFRKDTLVLFANCLDAYLAFEEGVRFDTLNVANLHYSPGKKQLCVHIALDENEEHFLTYLKEHNVKLDFRCVPGEVIALSW